MNTLTLSKQENYAVVQLDRGSSNPINIEMFQELIDTFNMLEKDGEVKGVVLTGKGNFFSAGLDVIELYSYDKVQIEKLFDVLFEAMKRLISFSKPMVAAVNGHSPAGGCVLAMCADYRVMAEGKYRIGLNEIPVGIIMPQYVFETYAYWIGRGKAAKFILEGKLCTNQEALNSGLVDVVVAQEKVLETSIEKIKFYSKFSTNTWSKSKLVMRAALLAHFEVFNATLKQDLIAQWWSAESREILRRLVDRLTKK